MFVQPSLTESMSLEQLSNRLAANDVVAGVVWIGSTGTDQQTIHSDYDVQLFVRPMPAPLHVVLYEQLARLVLAPVGGLWSEPATSVGLAGEWTMADVATAVAFWQKLITGE